MKARNSQPRSEHSETVYWSNAKRRIAIIARDARGMDQSTTA